MADRRKKLVADPTNLALHDDLVVALDRLGRFDEALAAVEAANKLRPNRYETESNWGTVLLHAGKLEDGLAHIDAAVRINPDAHFGREVYQQKLVRWALDARKAGRTLPASDVSVSGENEHTVARIVTADWLTLPDYNARAERPAHRSAALKGVLGMMRTGQHEHPVLLEALGRLLTGGMGLDTGDDPTEDAKRLAARAYLRAADVAPDVAAKRAYRGMGQLALSGQLPHPYGPVQSLRLEEVETDLRRELADADAWYAELRVKEVGWIQGAMDPDAEFAKLYAADPEVVGDKPTLPTATTEWHRTSGLGVTATACLGVVVCLWVAVSAVAVVMLLRLVRRRRALGEWPV